MDEKPETTLGPGSRRDRTSERTPLEIVRFRRRIARGVYDRAEVAEVVARRLLARGDLDPPPSKGPFPHP